MKVSHGESWGVSGCEVHERDVLTSPTPLKARSHGAFFLLAFAMQKMDCVGLYDTVHTVRFLLACDTLVCATSHMSRLHTHSVRLRLRFLQSLQLVSLGWRSFSCVLLCFLHFANVVCLCQNKQINR